MLITIPSKQVTQLDLQKKGRFYKNHSTRCLHHHHRMFIIMVHFNHIYISLLPDYFHSYLRSNVKWISYLYSIKSFNSACPWPAEQHGVFVSTFFLPFKNTKAQKKS